MIDYEDLYKEKLKILKEKKIKVRFKKILLVVTE